MKVKENAFVISQEEIAPSIYDLRLAVSFAKECRAGQFVALYMDGRGFLLPRPISICQVGGESIRLVYRIAGKGTQAFSQLKSHDRIEVMGPLGNGFPLEAAAGKRAVLIGGGIGIPPMIALGEALTVSQSEQAEDAPLSVSFAMGYRSETFLTDEMTECLEDSTESLKSRLSGGPSAEARDWRSGQLLIATEDGSAGTKGTVIDAMKAAGVEADILFACGPAPMLKALKTYAEEIRAELYVSLEEKMACGIGACLGCVCESKEIDSHSHVHNKRICKDGPVLTPAISFCKIDRPKDDTR